MVTSVASPADMVNLALVRIGHAWRVGNLYDGSKAAKLALDIYSQTRDQLQRDNDFGFPLRQTGLTLLKSAPIGGYIYPNFWNPAVNPPLPWWYEYTYPPDCLRVRSIFYPQVFVPIFDPQPNTFDTVNDNSFTPARQVIVTNCGPAAQLNYVGQVTDPATWNASFIEEFAAQLGRRLAPALAGMDVTKLEAADEQAESSQAANMVG